MLERGGEKWRNGKENRKKRKGKINIPTEVKTCVGEETIFGKGS
jgi:hypothetical protein